MEFSKGSTSLQRRRPAVFFCVVILLGLSCLLWKSQDHHRGLQTRVVKRAVVEPREEEFRWEQTTPSESLEYHDCFDGFQCARLDVPMDYNRTDGQGRRVALALTRLPAKVPVTHPQYGGAILINPGGPGGSGVMQALGVGRDLQTIVDAEEPPSSSSPSSDGKYFDIIGFDPRAVNNTTPGFTCFPTVTAQRIWELQDEAEGALGSSATSLSRKWQRAMALNPGCSEALNTPPNGTDEALGEHINTPAVARDLLEIAERHGEWREKQGQEAQHQHDLTHGHDSTQQIVARTRWNRGQERVLYWGRSYGTILGTTFAAMYPDRISRLVLDGVVDGDRYYTGKGSSPVHDADAIFDKFGVYCDQAGPDKCPLYSEGGPSSIKEAFLALDAQIYNTSVPVLATAKQGPEIITWSDVRTLLRVSMYQPLEMFPVLARALKQLQNGEQASVMVDFKLGRRSSPCPDADSAGRSQCQQSGPWSTECRDPRENEPFAATAIMCSDSEYLTQMSQSQFQGIWDGLRNDSHLVGDYWASSLMLCAGWKNRSKWKPPTVLSANTSHPLLFVSNSYDPATPLIGARRMAHKFPGSAVLQQESEGHTSASAPSLCVAKAIRKYVQTGALPEQSLCDANEKPFIGSVHDHNLSGGDKVLLKALKNQMPS